MWLLAGSAVTVAWLSPRRADSPRGEHVFQRCIACHSVADGEDKLPGPGTEMGPPGLRDADDRRDAIDYLERSGSMPAPTLRRTP